MKEYTKEQLQIISDRNYSELVSVSLEGATLAIENKELREELRKCEIEIARLIKSNTKIKDDAKELQDRLAILDSRYDSLHKTWLQTHSENVRLQSRIAELESQGDPVAVDLLKMIYDKWEEGTPCYENPDDAEGFVGLAFDLSEQENKKILECINSLQPAPVAQCEPVQNPVYEFQIVGDDLDVWNQTDKETHDVLSRSDLYKVRTLYTSPQPAIDLNVILEALKVGKKALPITWEDREKIQDAIDLVESVKGKS